MGIVVMTMRSVGILLCALLACGPVRAGPSGPYRGPQNNGIYPASGLLQEWPEGGPKLLWRYPLGVGYGGVTVANGKVYITAGYDCALHEFTLDGQLRWKVRTGSGRWARFPGTRSTPLVHRGMAIGTSPDANIYAVDLQKCEIRWKVSAWKSFGAGKGSMGWGYPETPLLHDGCAVINTCSRFDETPPFIALDVGTGKAVWSADAGKGKQYSATDVSGAAFRHGNRDLIAWPTWRYLACLEAKTGKRLWEIRIVGQKRLTPVYSDGYLLWGAGRQVQMLRLSPDGNCYEILWTRRDGIREYSHAVVYAGRVYLFGNPYLAPEPKSASASGSAAAVYAFSADALPGDLRKQGRETERRARRTTQLLCLDAQTGRLLASRPCAHPGHIIAADGRVYVVDRLAAKDKGPGPARLSLIKPTPEGFEVVGSFVPQLTDKERRLWGGDTQAFGYQIHVNPVIAASRLFVRYGPLLVYDLRRDPTAAGGHGTDEGPPAAGGAATGPAAPREVEKLPPDQRRHIVDLAARFQEQRDTAVAQLCRLDAARLGPCVPALTALMEAPGERAWLWQCGAARVLQHAGPAAGSATPRLGRTLVSALSRGDGALAGLTLRTIERIAPQGMDAQVSHIADLLDKDDVHVRFLAAKVLGDIGAAAAKATPALIAALESEPDLVAGQAGEALAAVGGKDVVTRLERLLDEGDRRRMARACDVLGKLGEQAAPALSRLIALAGGADPETAVHAVRAIGAVGPAAQEAVPVLVKHVPGDHHPLGLAAAEALGALGPAAKAGADALARGLGDARLDLARACSGALVKLGPAAASVAARLARALARADEQIRSDAADALVAIGEPAVPALINTLADSNSGAGVRAADTLRKMGAQAVRAAPALATAARSTSGPLATSAAYALYHVDPSREEAAVNAALTWVDSGDAVAVSMSSRILEEIVQRSQDRHVRRNIVEGLTRVVKSDNDDLRWSAVKRLAGLGKEARSAIPALSELLWSLQDEARKKELKQAIRTIQPDARVSDIPEMERIQLDLE